LKRSPAPRAAAKTSKQHSQLPVIHQLIIDNGTITYQDYRRKRHLKVGIARTEGYTDQKRNNISLTGKGHLGQQP
jgi:hypothetical protein